MKKQKFLRVGYTQYSKLGLRRKKKQVYRKANGIDNKVRLNMKGHLRNVRVGFRTQKSTRDLINGKMPVLIHNIEEMKMLKENEIALIAKIGMKKRVEIMKYAQERKIAISNINPKRVIEKFDEMLKKKKEEKEKREQKHKDKEKKAKEAEKKKEEEKNKENLEDKTENKTEHKPEEKTQ